MYLRAHSPKTGSFFGDMGCFILDSDATAAGDTSITVSVTHSQCDPNRRLSFQLTLVVIAPTHAGMAVLI